MSSKNKLLTILPDAERYALYGLPDFDDGQRFEYLSLSEAELALACGRPGLRAQVYCILQIGYFKAKHAFFRFAWDEVEDDGAFTLSRYFNGQVFERKPVTKHEHYTQRVLIAKLFGYQLWSGEFLPQLVQRSTQIVRRDVTPGFIVTELITWLNEHKIVRPGYTTLQELISEALSTERRRMGALLAADLDNAAKAALAQLLVRDDTLSELAALKQDAKDFGWRQVAKEREKLSKLEPLYRIAKALLPKLAISHQNLHYYSNLANFYTIYELRHLKPEQTHLYLLCYAWQRYRQITDNLVDALGYHMKQLEDETKARANKRHFLEQARRQQERPQVGRLLLIYVDDEVPDTTPFGTVRQRAFTIMPRDALQITGQLLSEKPSGRLALRWEVVDELAQRVRRHLRPLCMALNFSSAASDNPWIAALAWMKSVFSKQQRLSQRPLAECPEGTVPPRLRPYLLVFDADGNEIGIHADRYEFWIYRQIRKRLKSGETYLDDSMQHRCFTDEFVSLEEKAATLGQLDIPWLRQPLEVWLKELTDELHQQWLSFNSELPQGKLKHLQYDAKSKTLTWRRPKADNDKVQQERFYDQMSFCDIADVFRFVDEQCHFLSALTPLQPRYAKHVADRDSLMAVIFA
jgi:hypothetical protein